jgi:transcriptional regulator with XRE-family HTH domain
VRNPFRKIREENQATLRDFALLLGVSVPFLMDAEAGVPGDPAAILSALAGLGHDPDRLREEYRSWREARAAEIRERLRF